jgi:hypothetical protein
MSVPLKFPVETDAESNLSQNHISVKVFLDCKGFLWREEEMPETKTETYMISIIFFVDCKFSAARMKSVKYSS